MSAEPSISCLTVTRDIRRFPYLVRSIDCFRRQSWPRRELIIVSYGDAAYGTAIAGHLARLADGEIHHLHVDEPLTLGEARNRSVRISRGELVCLWDDDDLSHPRRLELQCRRMLDDGAEVSFFPDHLQYFEDTRELLWIDWSPDLFPGALLCFRRCLVQHPFPAREIDEDSPVREVLRASYPLSAPSGYGYLYLYCYTGLNVYAREHHESIRRIHDPTFVRGRLPLLRENLAHYGLDLRDVKLCGGRWSLLRQRVRGLLARR